jgi:hypothetical protein
VDNVTICRKFSQSENRFNFRDIMDTGKILLVDLSGVDIDAGSILGCLMLSLLHSAGQSRSDSDPTTRRPFHIYCNDADRFPTSAIMGMIYEMRRFSVSLTLAHQYLSQLDSSRLDAVCGVGSTLIFRVDAADAAQLRPSLHGLVEVNDLTTLTCGQAIARIGTEVVRIRTYPPVALSQASCADLIIRQSHQQYYQPTTTITGIGAGDTP